MNVLGDLSLGDVLDLLGEPGGSAADPPGPAGWDSDGPPPPDPKVLLLGPGFLL